MSGNVEARHPDPVGLALATTLAITPLLPYGPVYLGLPAGGWTDLAVVLLVALWLGERLTGFIRDRADVGPTGRPVSYPLPKPVSRILLTWGGFAVVASGAAAVGLAAENAFGSPVFFAHLRELPARLAAGTDMARDPLHPVRIWLTLVEGAVVFGVVADLCRHAASPRRRARMALDGWLTGFAVVSAIAVFQYVTRSGLHPYWREVNPHLVRAHSTLDDPNQLGSFLVLGLGLVSISALGQHKVRSAAMAVLGTMALAVTVSRTAWVALPVAGAGVLSLRRFGLAGIEEKQRHRIRLVARRFLVVLAVSVMGWMVAHWVVPDGPGYEPDSPAAAVLATLDPRTPLADVLKRRHVWWGAAVTMLREKPVTGVGLGRFPRLLPEVQDRLPIVENAHNFFLQILAEAGIVGLCALALLLAAVARGLVKGGNDEDPQSTNLATGLSLGSLAFALTLLLAHPLLRPSGQILWASLLAAGLILLHHRGPDTASAGGPSRRRAARTLFGIVLCVAVAVTYGVSAARMDDPAQSSRWGYTWGIYPEERSPGGGRFRWTAPRALLTVVPPPGAHHLLLRLGALRADVEHRPVDVEVTVNGQRHELTLYDHHWSRLRFRLRDLQERSRHALHVELVVSPPFEPMRAGASTDLRTLGVALRPLWFATGEPDADRNRRGALR